MRKKSGAMHFLEWEADHEASVPYVHPDLWWLHNGNRALRVGDWKIVAQPNSPWELYDLRADRAESHNLAAEHPEKVEELARIWSQHLDEFEAQIAKDQPAPAGNKKRKKKAAPSSPAS